MSAADLQPRCKTRRLAQRRYAVMFCDLVDSTAISAQLDDEKWRDLVGACLDAASAAVVEMGGHVAKQKSIPKNWVAPIARLGKA